MEYIYYTAGKYIFEWINKIIYLAKYQTDNLLNTNLTDLFYHDLYNKVYEVIEYVNQFEKSCTIRYNEAYHEAFDLREAKDATVETELPIHEYAKVATISNDKKLAMSYAMVDASIRSRQEYRMYLNNENEFKKTLSSEIFFINLYWHQNYDSIKENVYNLFMKKIDSVLEQFLFFQVNSYSKPLNSLILHNDSFDYTPYLNEVGDIIGKKKIPIYETENKIKEDYQNFLKKYKEDRKNIKFIHHFIKRKQVIKIIDSINICEKNLKSFIYFDKYLDIDSVKICKGYDVFKDNDKFIYCKYNKALNAYEVFSVKTDEKVAVLNKKDNDKIGINHKLLSFYSTYYDKNNIIQLLITFTTDITDIDDLNEYYQDLARLK